MGLFHKQTDTDDESLEEAKLKQEQFFDDYFREELRNHGRWYFDKVIKENGNLFKKDLEAVISQVNVDLKEHVTKQLDGAVATLNATLKEQVAKELNEQFTTYSKTMQEAQDHALKNMTEGSDELRQQYHELSSLLKDNIAEQNSMMHHAFEDHKSQLQAMDEAQAAALKWLNQSAEKLQDQYQEINTMLEKQVTEQHDRLIKAFEGNMARTVEHYILEALGDQFDMKAQMPGIIKQLEDNKQAMVDDIKL